MKRYDKYKQTGTPWIGEIPSHWEVKKLSYYADIITDFVASGSFADLRENVEYKNEPDFAMLVRTADLSKKGCVSRVYISKESYVFLQNSNLFGGEIVLPNIGSVGDVYLVPNDLYEHMSLAPNSIMVKTRFNKFVYYYFLSKSGNECLLNISQGTTQSKFNKTQLRGIKIIVPPLSEQEEIAAYLDKKCGSIDAVISTQERRIALLEELKQSVITEAVTHGINPDAKLRPSGIDWIGNIPEHWQVMPLKYAANKKGCCFIDGDWIESKDIVEEGIKYITTGNIGVLYYKEQGSGYISEKTFMSLACTEVFEGDILISRLNEPIGRSCIIPNLGNRVVTSVDNVIFRPDTDYYNKKFIVYYLNCNKFTEHANLIARGATMHRISRSMLGHQKMLVPPLSEQEEIVEYIESKIKPIDASIAKAKREIELLKELKQSVITEAVTGKIKVC